MLCAAKASAIPFGIALLVLGLVLADLDISIAGVATLALVYAAHVGSWSAAGRIWVLINALPDMVALQSWHTDDRGKARTFGAGMEADPYERGWKDFKRILASTEETSPQSTMLWLEAVALDVLVSKFVELTDMEIAWKSGSPGPMGDPSVAELVHLMRRFEKGWESKPGTYVRELTGFVPDSAAKGRETTLRFVVMLFQLICRSKIRNPRKQIQILNVVAKQDRDPENGSMAWVLPLMCRCL